MQTLACATKGNAVGTEPALSVVFLISCGIFLSCSLPSPAPGAAAEP